MDANHRPKKLILLLEFSLEYRCPLQAPQQTYYVNPGDDSS
jgi:hypothetical protein